MITNLVAGKKSCCGRSGRRVVQGRCSGSSGCCRVLTGHASSLTVTTSRKVIGLTGCGGDSSRCSRGLTHGRGLTASPRGQAPETRHGRYGLQGTIGYCDAFWWGL